MTNKSENHPSLGWALALISVAQLMVVLDGTITNIALPFIGNDLEIDPGNLQWIVTGYALAFGGFLLLGGRLGDLYGRRRIFMVGVTVFALASGLGGFAQNESMLLASRALQGLGAAMASPTALALITTTFPAGPPRNRAMSVYAMMSGVGGAIGLLLGGYLTGITPNLFGMEVDGWRLTFLINVPIGLLAAWFAPKVLVESETHPGELDLPGAVAGTSGLIALVYGITRAGDQRYGWGDVWTLAFILGGLALLGLFIMIERRVDHPLMPFRILADRTRGTAFVAMMMVPAAMFAMFFFLSLLIQDVMGYSPLHAGVAFLPFTFGMIAGALTSSRLVARFDPRVIAGTGTLLAGLALFFYSTISVDDSPANLLAVAQNPNAFVGDSINYWVHLFGVIILMAFGMGLTFVPMTLAAVHGISERDSGIGSGVLNTMQQIGGALGLATLSTVAVHYTQEKAATLVAAVTSLAPPGAPEPTADQASRIQDVVSQAAFTHGATNAFFVGAFMVWAASAVIWIFLNVRYQELAKDGPAEGVHLA
ncbi:MAG TPA: MFS transporter [Marmoricola sp.]|nr:MFS transporter [Marmoricola sp.]